MSDGRLDMWAGLLRKSVDSVRRNMLSGKKIESKAMFDLLNRAESLIHFMELEDRIKPAEEEAHDE